MKRVVFILCVLLTAAPALAQEPAQCAALVQLAAAQAAQRCATVGRDEICYVDDLEAVIRTDAGGTFESAGDRVPAGAVQAVNLAAPNVEDGSWGMALAQISANLPEASVTLALLGPVAVENVGLPEALATLPAVVRAQTGANLRAQPSPDAPVLRPLPLGEAALAIGRLEDRSWVWVQLGDLTLGWIAADLLTVSGDLNRLTALDPVDFGTPNTIYGPFQAFTFVSGMSECAPPGGILVQSPASDRIIVLWVNGALVVLQPNSTVFFTGSAAEMRLHTLEGEADLIGRSETRYVRAGERLSVPLEDGLMPDGAMPRLPESYVYADIKALPVTLLPRPVVVPLALGGIVRPAQRGVDPLNGVGADSACTVAAVAETRLRGGPGTNYPVLALIGAGDSARPDGRAAGTDGKLWWRLSPEFWVSADAMVAAGACGLLPLVEPPPPPPSPVRP